MNEYISLILIPLVPTLVLSSLYLIVYASVHGYWEVLPVLLCLLFLAGMKGREARGGFMSSTRQPRGG